jgi:autotransporter translocation and assembly factor TamB
VRLSLILIAIAACLAVASPAVAADVTGRWNGKTSEGYDVVLTLTSQGTEISGTLLGADGKTEYPLKEVHSDGENLAFVVDVEWQGEPLKILAQGKTMQDRIELHLETADRSWSGDVVLRRETSKT